MLRLTRSKAQSTAEYAIVIGVVIAVAVGMQIYVKRGLQAKVKGVTDFNDSQAVSDGILGTTQQFEPDYTTTTGAGMHTTVESAETATTTEGGGVKRSIVGTDETSRTGVQVTKGE